jgi:hypothetical protein
MFPGEDISRLLPEHLKSFASDLRKYPVDYPKWFYGQPPKEIYQGDVIAEARTALIDDDGTGSYREGAVVVISNTCDVQPNRDDYLLLAPLLTLEERYECVTLTGQARIDHFHDLKRNRLASIMFFPAVEGMGDSWLDFTKICPVSSEYFYSKKLRILDQRVASLSQKGHYFFLMKLAYHFCRPENPADAKRSA